MTNFAVFIFSTSQYCLKVFTVKAYIEFARQKWFLTVNWLWIAVDKMGIITKLAAFSPCLYFYSMRKAVRVILIVGFLSGVSLLLVGWRHPIFFKWLSGTARCIGKPIKVDVYLNDTLNENISVFKADSYWDGTATTCYLLHFATPSQVSRAKILSVLKGRLVIGLPTAVGQRDYDIIVSYLFQSETGSKFTDINDEIKGFGFDPGLRFAEKSIHFRIPAATNDTGFDSIRIEL